MTPRVLLPWECLCEHCVHLRRLQGGPVALSEAPEAEHPTRKRHLKFENSEAQSNRLDGRPACTYGHTVQIGHCRQRPAGGDLQSKSQSATCKRDAATKYSFVNCTIAHPQMRLAAKRAKRERRHGRRAPFQRLAVDQGDQPLKEQKERGYTLTEGTALFQLPGCRPG
jgi:hypothetical protein